MRNRTFILLIFVLLLVFGCKSADPQNARYTRFDSLIDHGKPLSLGDERDVYVFADHANWQKLKPFVQSSIEREIVLVYPERYFHMFLAEISDLGKYSRHPNLLFIGDLKSNGPVSKHMQSSLAPDFIQRVQQSGGDLFVAKNYASRDQITMYLMGDSQMNLAKIGAIQSDKIFEILSQRYVRRLGYQAYQQPVIEDSFFELYPFDLKIPNNYVLYSNDKVGRFLSLLYRASRMDREIPDKYINIYHEDMPENVIDYEWLIAKRQELGEKYFEGDVFDEETIRKEAARLGEYEALRIVGAWKNETHLIGGAFQSYAFWHEDKAFIVDNIVYFPAGDKLPILMELYAISSSMKIK